MLAEYKRDFNHNYLVLKADQDLEVNSYQVQMILSNNIKGLLSCTIENIDNEVHFCYDITGRQSLKNLYENRKIGLKDLQGILEGIFKVLEKTGDYLLEAKDVVLNWEYSYMDLKNQELFFCYLPGSHGKMEKNLQELLEALLPKINHQEEEAVALGYDFYRRCIEEDFQAGSLKKELYEKEWKKEIFPKEEEVKKETLWKREENELEEEFFEEIFQKEEQDETEDIWFYGKGIATGIPIFSAILLYAFGYLKELWGYGILFAVCMAGFLGILFCSLMEKRTGKIKEEEENKRKDKREAYGEDNKKSYRENKRKDNRGANRKANRGDNRENKKANREDNRENKKANREDSGENKKANRGNKKAYREDTRNNKKAYREDNRENKKANREGNRENKKAYRQDNRENKREREASTELKEESQKEWNKMAEDGRSKRKSGGEETTLLRQVEQNFPILKAIQPENLPSIVLDKHITILGKLQGAVDVVIPISTVSRIHAKIIKENEGIFLMDLNSTNGTYVEEEMMIGEEKRKIKKGERIRLGEVIYEIC